ncbi:MAG: hypothetical protein IKB34_02065 [Clostridia bacterium]|nr:hypothetical protein [Clostridia bacterium]
MRYARSTDDKHGDTRGAQMTSTEIRAEHSSRQAVSKAGEGKPTRAGQPERHDEA